MFSIYQLQFPIFHAKCMILGIILFYIAVAWMIQSTLDVPKFFVEPALY